MEKLHDSQNFKNLFFQSRSFRNHGEYYSAISRYGVNFSASKGGCYVCRHRVGCNHRGCSSKKGQ